MDRETDTFIKQRELNFCTMRPYNQADPAAEVLTGLDGVVHLESHPNHLLHVHYDVRKVTLEAIEELLTDLGYHLSSKLLFKLKRALYYYTEETERINMGIEEGVKECKRLFINRYDQLQHGCRDELPEHWRNYR